MAGSGGRSKSAMGHSASVSSVTKLPPIGKKHGSAGLPNDHRPTKKAWKGHQQQSEVSSVVREIVNIYKEAAKPDAKGLTKTDFRNLFIKNNPTDRRKKDRRLQDEVCGDMFRMLDKDGDGYVMLQDLLKHFVPPQQLKRMPADFIRSVMNRHGVVVEKSDTPRLAPSGLEEIREIHDLWLSYAEDVGPNQGRLDREAVIEILAGKHNAEFNWMEAREAADRFFAELPSTANTISLGDMANHLQEVMFVPWAELSDGDVRKFKKHTRVDIDLGKPVESVLNGRFSNEKVKASSMQSATFSGSNALKRVPSQTLNRSPKPVSILPPKPIKPAGRAEEPSTKTEIKAEKS